MSDFLKQRSGPSDLDSLSKQIGLGGSDSADNGLQSLGSIFSRKQKTAKTAGTASVAAQLAPSQPRTTAPPSSATPPPNAPTGWSAPGQPARTASNTTPAPVRPAFFDGMGPGGTPTAEQLARVQELTARFQRAQGVRPGGVKKRYHIVWVVIAIWIGGSAAVNGISDALRSAVHSSTSSSSKSTIVVDGVTVKKAKTAAVATRITAIARDFGPTRLDREIASLRRVIPKDGRIRDISFLSVGDPSATVVRHGKAYTYAVGQRGGTPTTLTSYIRRSRNINLSSIDTLAPVRLLVAAEYLASDSGKTGWSGITLESGPETPPTLGWIASRESDPVVYYYGDAHGRHVKKSRF